MISGTKYYLEMNARTNYLNMFTQGMADIKISRHPLRKEIFLLSNDREYDMYQDTTTTNTGRIKKMAIVQLNKDMSYVQEMFDDLLDDASDKLPYNVILTMTGLSRVVTQKDNMIIDGTKYAVAKVKPINRNLSSVIECTVYPERTDFEDPFTIISITPRLRLEEIVIADHIGEEIVLDILYGGSPTALSFDGTTWQDFTSYVKYTVSTLPFTVYLKDATDTIKSMEVGA